MQTKEAKEITGVKAQAYLYKESLKLVNLKDLINGLGLIAVKYPRRGDWIVVLSDLHF